MGPYTTLSIRANVQRWPDWVDGGPEMIEFLSRLILTDDFMPHGHCYFWRPEIVWLHVISDGLIAAAYATISITLYLFVRQRKDLPYTWMFLCFAVFIVACGATHAMEIVTLWTPVYRLSGVVKAITATASVPTAALLLWLIPHALQVPSPSALRSANAQLQSTQAELRRANAQLQSTNAELEAFSYSVAHDLRAPLRAIHGFTTLLAEDLESDLQPEPRDSLNEIRSNARRMDELIDALLGLSRVSRSPLAPEEVDLSAMVQEAFARLRALDPRREVETTVEPGVVVLADRALLEVAVHNLVDNAWKFSVGRHPAHIEFGVEMPAGEPEYFIRDDGAGFDPQYAGRMFTAFQRFHSKDEFDGTGIGLATVKRIITRHGGIVRAEGDTGSGAVFRFTLPRPNPPQRSQSA